MVTVFCPAAAIGNSISTAATAATASAFFTASTILKHLRHSIPCFRYQFSQHPISISPIPQRHCFPRFAAVVVERDAKYRAYRACREATAETPMPQRHRFPRFAAVVVEPDAKYRAYRACREATAETPLPQRHLFPRFAAVVVERDAKYRAYRACREATAETSLPQRHLFPRFAAVVERAPENTEMKSTIYFLINCDFKVSPENQT